MPGGQTIFHELTPVTGWLDPRVLLSIGVLGLLGAIAWGMRRVEGTVTLGIVWFLAALVPSAALVITGRGEPMAEQRVYLASAGLFLAFGTIVARLEAWRRWNARPLARFVYRGIIVAMLVILSMHTLLRNAVWGDPVTLWSEAVDKAPTSWHAQLLFGEALHDAGRHEEAIGAFTTALRTQPEEPAIYPKLGLCLIEVGRLKPAAAAFEKLRQLDPRSPDGTNGLGALALVAGQPEQARSLYEETLLYDPWNVPARVGLVKIEELQGNAAAACADARRSETSLRRHPAMTNASVGTELGSAAADQPPADGAAAPPARARAGLVWTLIRTDFKVRYHGTAGGFIWALLKPLDDVRAADGGVFVSVRSNPDYKLDLIIGLFLWDFFAEARKPG